MRKRRTRRELHEAGETVESLRSHLDMNGRRCSEFAGYEDTSERLADERRLLLEELSILEGRRFPNDKAYDDA
jgi:hypothetical protein